MISIALLLFCFPSLASSLTLGPHSSLCHVLNPFFSLQLLNSALAASTSCLSNSSLSNFSKAGMSCHWITSDTGITSCCYLLFSPHSWVQTAWFLASFKFPLLQFKSFILTAFLQIPHTRQPGTERHSGYWTASRLTRMKPVQAQGVARQLVTDCTCPLLRGAAGQWNCDWWRM